MFFVCVLICIEFHVAEMRYLKQVLDIVTNQVKQEEVTREGEEMSEQEKLRSSVIVKYFLSAQNYK